MKTTREEILNISLKLFAERGFEAVSTSMIAAELGITKGALYRHFASKQAIFDSIVARMFELDEHQAEENNVPAGTYAEDAESYKITELKDVCEFVNEQLLFWTENEFACRFRRMITIEQYKNREMTRLYQDTIGDGPVRYTTDLFNEMIGNGRMNADAAGIGAENLAIRLFAPLHLSIQLFDGGNDISTIKKNLRLITEDFYIRWAGDR